MPEPNRPTRMLKEKAARTQAAIDEYRTLTSPHVESFNWVSTCQGSVR
jgi:hypothetical protein